MPPTLKSGTAREPDVESNSTSWPVNNPPDWVIIIRLGVGVFILLLFFCACFFSCIALGRVLHPHDIQSSDGDPTGEYVAALLSGLIFSLIFTIFVWLQDITIHDDLFRKYGYTSVICILSMITLGPASVALGSKILEVAVRHWHVVVKDTVVHYLTGYAILIPVPFIIIPCCCAYYRGEGIFYDGDLR